MPVACHHGHMHINSALCMADTGMHAVCRVPLQHAYHLASAWKVQMPGVVIHAYAYAEKDSHCCNKVAHHGQHSQLILSTGQNHVFRRYLEGVL